MRCLFHSINWSYLLCLVAGALALAAFPACCILWLFCLI